MEDCGIFTGRSDSRCNYRENGNGSRFTLTEKQNPSTIDTKENRGKWGIVMVTLTARQSVILKCSMQASVMLGNYEFYYGAGLLCQLNGINVSEDIRPDELKKILEPELAKEFEGDEREKYLRKLLLAYSPSEEYDEQMKELLLWGLKEERLWKVKDREREDR